MSSNSAATRMSGLTVTIAIARAPSGRRAAKAPVPPMSSTRTGPGGAVSMNPVTIAATQPAWLDGDDGLNAAPLPRDAILVADTGYSGIWTATCVELAPPQTYLRAAGSLGWSFPAAIGAKCACPDRPVLCFSGDGAIYYHLPELETARRLGLPLVLVINNNSGFGQGLPNIRRLQGNRPGNAEEIIRFGPITENNRLERMLFWPDRKSIGLRQVQAALAAKDGTAADPAGVATKSVAMQGLGALEFVLYGTGADTLAAADDPYRCAYGRAIAGNVEQISAEVAQAWDKPGGFAATWETPGPDNAVYRDGNEAGTGLVGVFIEGLDLIRDVRVKGFLGMEPGADKPRLAIYWRSDNTARSLAANLAGMDVLFQVSKLGEALPEEDRWIAESIHIQLVNGGDTARQVAGPIDAALADPARRALLEHFSLITSSLSNLFGTRLTAAFGLTAGFSSLDGD